MMRNKKGVLRIIEAVVASLIILGVLLFVVLPRYSVDNPFEDSVYDLENSILDEIERSEDLRRYVLDENVVELQNFLNRKLSGNFKGKVKVCGVEAVCIVEVPYNKDVFVKERVISSTLEEYSPKKVVLFVWLG